MLPPFVHCGHIHSVYNNITLIHEETTEFLAQNQQLSSILSPLADTILTRLEYFNQRFNQ